MKACPNELELSRALTISVDAELDAHLVACPSCLQTRDALGAAIALARELPVELPSTARREEVRTALLAAAAARAARPAARRKWLVPVVGIAAAAALVGFAASRGDREPAPALTRATVHPLPGASFTAMSGPPDEIIRLRDGTIDIEVETLQPGERFRIVVGDGEVEVRGTAFEVTATADHLVAVRVTRGRVEVTPRGERATILGAGDSWHVALARTEPAAPIPPPVVAVPAQVAVVPAPRVDRHREPASHVAVPIPAPAAPTAPVRTAEEIAYDHGWDAMRAGEFRQAAAAFARSLALSPDGALAEDAGYWRAVALARVPRAAEAINAFRDFVDAHPRSAHAGEASAMLGWLLVDAHEPDEAAMRFRAASSDPSAAVQRSAKTGLETLVRAK